MGSGRNGFCSSLSLLLIRSSIFGKGESVDIGFGVVNIFIKGFRVNGLAIPKIGFSHSWNIGGGGGTVNRSNFGAGAGAGGRASGA